MFTKTAYIIALEKLVSARTPAVSFA